MRDIRIIEIRDVLPVVGIGRVEDFDPPTLLLRGEDFNSVKAVFINDERSPSVMALNNRELLAQVPASQQNQSLRTITVTSAKFTRTTRNSTIEYIFNPSVPGISGIERLTQLFVKILFQSPSTFSKLGGGLLLSLGSGRDPQSLTSDLHLAVDKTRQQIVQIQSQSTGIALDEQLLDAQLLESRYDRGKLAIVGSVKLSNKLGKSSVVGLGL